MIAPYCPIMDRELLEGSTFVSTWNILLLSYFVTEKLGLKLVLFIVYVMLFHKCFDTYGARTWYQFYLFFLHNIVDGGRRHVSLTACDL